jgi:hypothetical protein
MKPIARIIAIESSRVRTSETMPPSLPAGAPQIRLSDARSSAKTVVAPIKMVSAPSRMPSRFDGEGSAFSTISEITFAPAGPTSPRTWVSSSPRTASSPRKKPASAVTITKTGASEKSV